VYLASKILALLTQPLLWIAALLVASLVVSRKPAWSRGLVGVALGLLLLMGWQPLPDFLIRQLESQYAEVPPDADFGNYFGIVVLGGSTEPGYVARAHVQPLLNEAAERLTATVAMLHDNPHLHVLYTGGGKKWSEGDPSEADLAHMFFASQSLPAQGVLYESASRTTHENAILSAQLPGVDVTRRWLLVTSAWHMPRSMATFTRAGWNVTAYPVDFRTGRSTPWTAYSLEAGIRSWQLVLHERLGGLAYRLTGRM
jgi:uncharacterized SAM-binding protein YcdF (DUF218 family)